MTGWTDVARQAAIAARRAKAKGKTSHQNTINRAAGEAQREGIFTPLQSQSIPSVPAGSPMPPMSKGMKRSLAAGKAVARKRAIARGDKPQTKSQRAASKQPLGGSAGERMGKPRAANPFPGSFLSNAQQSAMIRKRGKR